MNEVKVLFLGNYVCPKSYIQRLKDNYYIANDEEGI